MANRLTKIYTRSGDDGTTGLANGDRVPKSSVRIDTFGTVDETNSTIGLVLSNSNLPPTVQKTLSRIQDELFDLGAELALPGHLAITPTHIERLEADLDGFNADLPPLKDFVLPGGSPAASACHLARAICRRAERCAWAFAEDDEVNPELLKYLNRLSDLLFVIARVLARQAGASEVLWSSGRNAAD